MASEANAIIDFDPKDMPFRRLGSSGLRVPVFSLGGWLTLGGTVVGDPAKDIMKAAFDAGINMFDTAEEYGRGKSEIEMGRVIRELNLRREDLVITTKIYWGPRRGHINGGLSRKHIVEGLKGSLERLGLGYVDVVFAHRPDYTVPMDEVVRAFNWVIEKGWAYYWATSEWTALQIEEAWHVADKLGLMGPIADQCQHHMLKRERAEGELAPLYKKYGMGTTAFSCLARGLLTGKYNDGIPAGSRYDVHSVEFNKVIKQLESAEGQEEIRKVRELTKFAEAELNTTPQALALAWVARNSNTSTVILGVTSVDQLRDNLEALKVMPKLTPEIMDKIEVILANKPQPPFNFGRPSLDPLGREGLYV